MRSWKPIYKRVMGVAVSWLEISLLIFVIYLCLSISTSAETFIYQRF